MLRHFGVPVIPHEYSGGMRQKKPQLHPRARAEKALLALRGIYLISKSRGFDDDEDRLFLRRGQRLRAALETEDWRETEALIEEMARAVETCRSVYMRWLERAFSAN